MTESIDGFMTRLDAVQSRLASLAARVPDPDALTDAEPSTGERWRAGQVWAHIAEFIQYWIGQVRHVVAARDAEPVGFGRTSNDPGRTAAIARDKETPVSVLWTGVHADIELLRAFLDSLGSDAWQTRGLHPRLGMMSTNRIVDEFLVGHLEQHADQLESLARQD